MSAWRSISSALAEASVSSANVTITPLIGCNGRLRRRAARKLVQALRSRSLSESWVVYRPAVSISIASSAKKKSILRVPAWARLSGATGNRKPELARAVVLPVPGGPITTNHGRW